MALPFPVVLRRLRRHRDRQGTMRDMVALSVFILVSSGLRMAQGVVGGRLGRVTAATACERGLSGTILAPAGAKPLSSRTEVPLGRRIGAGERVSYGIPSEVPAPAPFSRRKGDFPRIPPPRDFVAGQQNPIDTHSSCERVSTWARHRFVYECVSVEKDAGIPLPGRQDSVAGQWNPGHRAAEFRSGRGYAEKFNFSSLYSARSASLPIN